MSGRYDDAMCRVHELERENAELRKRLADWGRVALSHSPTREAARLIAESWLQEAKHLSAEVDGL